jgi:ketosteroid isomerase-like protein
MGKSSRPTFALAAILLASFSIACSSGWKEPKTYTFKTATGAEQYERLLWDAVKNKDRLTIASHLASNFVRQDESGTKNKEQYLAELDQINLSDYSLAELNVTPQGNDMVVTYAITLRGNKAGKPFPSEPIRYLSVWQQQKAGWVLVAQSAIGMH